MGNSFSKEVNLLIMTVSGITGFWRHLKDFLKKYVAAVTGYMLTA
jgi:hypothetical protein